MVRSREWEETKGYGREFKRSPPFASSHSRDLRPEIKCVVGDGLVPARLAGDHQGRPYEENQNAGEPYSAESGKTVAAVQPPSTVSMQPVT